jgi:predicted lipoprotein with Yx(FWY)xxD motif
MRQLRQLHEGENKRIRFSAVTRGWVLLALMAALGVFGFLLGAGSIAFGGTRTGATVNLQKTKLGSILVNSKGHTLYLFKKDTNGKSSCSASCAKLWPPLLSRGKPTAGSGVKASLLGRTRRSNGSLQVTYNKHPLYSYTLDTKAGQTKGEGVLAFGARWYAVSAKGTAVVRTTTTTTVRPLSRRCTWRPRSARRSTPPRAIRELESRRVGLADAPLDLCSRSETIVASALGQWKPRSFAAPLRLPRGPGRS